LNFNTVIANEILFNGLTLYVMLVTNYEISFVIDDDQTAARLLREVSNEGSIP